MAFRDALSITLNEEGPRLELANELLSKELTEGGGMVLLEGGIGLYRHGDRVVCEVITRFPQSKNTERFAAELGEGQQLLGSSTLGAVLAKERLEWVVVDDYGMGRAQVWPAS